MPKKNNDLEEQIQELIEETARRIIELVAERIKASLASAPSSEKVTQALQAIEAAEEIKAVPEIVPEKVEENIPEEKAADNQEEAMIRRARLDGITWQNIGRKLGKPWQELYKKYRNKMPQPMKPVGNTGSSIAKNQELIRAGFERYQAAKELEE